MICIGRSIQATGRRKGDGGIKAGRGTERQTCVRAMAGKNLKLSVCVASFRINNTKLLDSSNSCVSHICATSPVMQWRRWRRMNTNNMRQASSLSPSSSSSLFVEGVKVLVKEDVTIFHSPKCPKEGLNLKVSDIESN